MGRNTIFREINMDTLNCDLEMLENLSKKISDLIHNNEFANISYLDSQRRYWIFKTREVEKKTNFMLTKLSRKKMHGINQKI